MIRTDLLEWEASKKGCSFRDVAGFCGMSYEEFMMSIWRGVFDSDKIQIMIDKLGIDDIKAVFFYSAEKDEEQEEILDRMALCAEIL